MKCRVTLLSASLALVCIMPTTALAVDDQDGSSTLEQRRALSNRIKAVAGIEKKLPIPVPSGLFGIYAFPERGQGVAGINYQHHEFDGLIAGNDSVSAETVVTTAPNRFLKSHAATDLEGGAKKCTGRCDFPFANFAINDRFALVALAPLIRKRPYWRHLPVR